jgi:hypothetical protein
MTKVRRTQAIAATDHLLIVPPGSGTSWPTTTSKTQSAKRPSASSACTVALVMTPRSALFAGWPFA